MLQSLRSCAIGPAAFCALSVFIGCLPVADQQEDPSGDSASLLEQVLSAAPRIPVTSEDFTETEPNDDFVTAPAISFQDSINLVGSIHPGSAAPDRDLYELGPANAGDRVRAALTHENGRDLVFCLFDEQQRLLAYIDHSSFVTGPREIDFVLHESIGALYAMMATRSSTSDMRSYITNVTLESAAGLPSYRPQVVVLNFRGANNVRIGNRAPVNVPPFDIANIDPRFAEQTEALITQLVALVREEYDGLDVDVYADDDPNIPDAPHTIVYFGTSDPALLGLADNIDPYNANLSQAGILYADTFALFNPLVTSLTDHAQVLANVTCHEIGHLLGLRHTHDPNSIMDVTATARQMMRRQWFKKAKLHSSVAPIGYQDEPAMLSWTVGGELKTRSVVKRAFQLKPSDVVADPDDFVVPRHLLCSCGEADHDEQTESQETAAEPN